MVRSSIICLSLIWLLSSCESEYQWYQRSFSEEEQKALAIELNHGVSYFYQGTVASEFHALEALRLDSSNGDIWRELGTARVKRGILDEMDHYYAGAVERKPDPWQGFRAYLYLYFYRDYTRAIADFNAQDSIMGMVGNSQAQDHDYMRGLAYYGLKDYDQAQLYLEKYINRISRELGSDWVDVYAKLYHALCRQKQGAPFEELLGLFKEIDPDLADVNYHLSKLYHSQGQKPLALRHLMRAQASFNLGYYHRRPYVEVLDQLYQEDIDSLGRILLTNISEKGIWDISE